MVDCCLCQVLLSIPLIIVVVGLTFRIWYRRVSGRCLSKNKMNGKTVVITGANIGIGYYTAHDLASRGARVILACRNKIKAEKARESIIKDTKNENVFVKIVDVSDLNSVRKFCQDILATEKRIDVLVNNAGGGFPERRESAQGFELTMATNHFGHFLLTILLSGLLKKSSPSRIINVSSLSHKHHSGNFSDIHFKVKKFKTYTAYAQSKLCNVLFTKELSHKLSNTGVIVNALHPGVVATDIMSKEGTIFGMVLSLGARLIFKDAVLGAQTIIHLAVADEVAKISGEYFVDCKIAECSKQAKDPGLAKKLWEISEEEVGLSNEERI